MNAFSYFVIENPDQSYLWIAPLILELYALKGVGFIRFVMRNYGSVFLEACGFSDQSPFNFQNVRCPDCVQAWAAVQGPGLVERGVDMFD